MMMSEQPGGKIEVPGRRGLKSRRNMLGRLGTCRENFRVMESEEEAAAWTRTGKQKHSDSILHSMSARIAGFPCCWIAMLLSITVWTGPFLFLPKQFPAVRDVRHAAPTSYRFLRWKPSESVFISVSCCPRIFVPGLCAGFVPVWIPVFSILTTSVSYIPCVR